MQTAKELKELIGQLPPEFQEEVRDFVEFLLKRKACRRGRKLRQDWAGALRDYINILLLSFRKKPWNGEAIERRGSPRFGFL